MANSTSKSNYDWNEMSLIVATGMKAFGEIDQGISDWRTQTFNAELADENARLAETAAKDVERQGRIDMERMRERIKLVVGVQRAEYGASGVNVNVGSPQEVLQETIRLGEADAHVVRRNAAKQAWGLKAQAFSLKMQAQQYRSLARSSMFSGLLAGGAQLFLGLSEIQANKS